MPRVIYVRVTTAEHGLLVDAVRNSRARSLQAFALEAILEATGRWSVDRPPIAEAALEPPEQGDGAGVVPGPDDLD